MKARFAAVAMIAAGSAVLTGQAPAPLALDQLAGQWTGTGVVSNAPVRARAEFTPVLGNKFTRLSYAFGAASGRPDDRLDLFEGHAYYSCAPDPRVCGGQWFDSQGASHILKATHTSEALTSEWGDGVTPRGRTEYRLVGPDALVVTDWVRTAAGEWRQFGKVEYRRATTPATLAVPAQPPHPSNRFTPSLLERGDVKQAIDSIDARATGIVDEWIKLVEIPSPSGKEQARAAYIKAEMSKLGLSDIKVDELLNVSGVRKGTGGGPTVVFCAHMDTVFPDGTDVTVKRQGDTLSAPGVGDDTSNLMATLEMFRALDRGGVKTKGDLIFLASSQEELGLVGAKHWLEMSGYHPDMFIAVDLSAEEVWYGALRIWNYKFVYTSPGAHTLESRGAPSPSRAVAKAIEALYAIELPAVAPGLGTFKLPVINVGMLGGGTVVNAIPREAWFTVDLRSLDTPTQDRLGAAVEAAAKRAADAEGVGFRMERKSFVDYAKARPQAERLNDVVVQTALATSNHFREPGTPAISPQDVGSTDANIAIAMGIPAVAVGAVRERGAHQLVESADARSIVPGIKSLIALAVSLAGQ